MKCPKCQNELEEIKSKRYYIKDGKKYAETWGFCFGNGKNHLESRMEIIKTEEVKDG